MNKPAYVLYLFIPVSALLALGVTGGWPATLAEGLCFLALLLHMLGRRGNAPLYRVPGFFPLVLLSGYALFQLLPLPPLLLKLLSPNTWKLYSETVWLVLPGAWMPLSVAPKPTLTEFFRLAAYASYYLLTVQVLADRARLKSAASFITVSTGLFALAGLVMFAFSGGRFFWPLGGWTFESGDSWAPLERNTVYLCLLAMVLPIALGQYLAIRPKVNYVSFRERLVDFFHHPTANIHVLLGFLLIALAISPLLGLSAPPVASGLAGLLLFTLLLMFRGWARGRSFFSGMSPAALLIMVALLGSGMIWGGGGSGSKDFRSEEVRVRLGQDSRKIIGDFPLFGTGLGTFSYVYPRYRTVRSLEMPIEHARNGFVEHMAEGGLAGMLLAGWFLFSLARRSWPLWRSRHNRTSLYLCAGAASGIGAILVGSTTAPILASGTVGLYFFLFSGVVFAAASCRNRGKESAGHEASPPAVSKWVGVSAAVLLAASLFFNIGAFVGKRKVPSAADTAAAAPGDPRERAAAEKKVGTAMRLDPLESSYPYLLADTGLASGEAKKTLDLFTSALRLNPLNSEYLQRLGLVVGNLGQRKKAESLLHSGVENDGANPERHKTFAFWLLSEGKKDQALDEIRNAIFWGPEQTGDFLALMALYGLTDDEMKRVLPAQSYPLLAFGHYLAGIGKEEAAEENYRAAIDYALQERWPIPQPFQEVTEFFSDRGRYNDALDVILGGIRTFPENSDFRFMAAGIYEHLGIEYRAIEEYRATLALDPDNRAARENLQKLTGEVN